MPPDDPSGHGSTPPRDPSETDADRGEATEHRDPSERIADPAPADWRTSTYSRTEPHGGTRRGPERGPEGPPSDAAERTPPPEEPPPLRGRHLAWVHLEGHAAARRPERGAPPDDTVRAAPPDNTVTPRARTDHSEPTPPADTRPIGPPSPPEVPPTPPDPPKAGEPEPVTRPVEAHPSPRREAAPAGTPDAPGVPSALGRLVAIVVTCGLAWALAVAVGVWLLVFLVSRSG